MANLAMIMISALAIALLSTTLQAQGVQEAGSGNAAEYVLLEPRPEQLVTTLPDGATVTANTTKCATCNCCLAHNPLMCLTTCCFAKSCTGRTCTSRMVSCGCNTCVY